MAAGGFGAAVVDDSGGRGTGYSAERSARAGTAALYPTARRAGAARRSGCHPAQHGRAQGRRKGFPACARRRRSPARRSISQRHLADSTPAWSASACRSRRSTRWRRRSRPNTATTAMCCRAPSCRRSSSTPMGAIVHIEVVEGYIDKVAWPPQLVALPRFLHRLRGENHRAAAGQYPHHRTLSAARRRSAGAEIQDQPAAVETQRAAPQRWWSRSPKSASTPTPILDNRGTSARGPFEYYGSATINNLFGQHEALTFTYAGVDAAQRTQLRRASATRKCSPARADIFRRWQRRLGNARHGASSKLLQYRTLGPYGDVGFSYPVHPVARKEHRSCRACSTAATTRAMRSARRYRTIACAAFAVKVDADFADAVAGINQFNVTVSQGIQGLGSTRIATRWPRGSAGRVDYDKIEVDRQPAIAPCSTSSRPICRSTASMPARRCWCPSSAGSADAILAARSIRRNCLATPASRPSASCATTCRPSRCLRQYGAALRLHRLRRPLHARRRARNAADSAGGLRRRRHPT